MHRITLSHRAVVARVIIIIIIIITNKYMFDLGPWTAHIITIGCLACHT
jgi:hypothetical protein